MPQFTAVYIYNYIHFRSTSAVRPVPLVSISAAGAFLRFILMGYALKPNLFLTESMVSNLHFDFLHWQLREAAFFRNPITHLVVITFETSLETDKNTRAPAQLGNITQLKGTRKELSRQLHRPHLQNSHHSHFESRLQMKRSPGMPDFGAFC